MPTSPAQRSHAADLARPADRADAAVRSARADPANRDERGDSADRPAEPHLEPVMSWPPAWGGAAGFDLHEQARARAQALRREAVVQAWADLDRAWAATQGSAGRAARRLAQRLRHHWQQRDEAPAQQA